MSLTYIYDKLEAMNSIEQEAYISNIFQQFNIKPLYPISDNFKNLPGKEQKSKNPLGYIVMHLDQYQLQQLVPKYLVNLCEGDTFNIRDMELIFIMHEIVAFIKGEITKLYFPYKPDKKEYLRVFQFGQNKYSEWSFLKLNPYLLIPAVMRHLYKYFYVREFDEESECRHLEHACSNIRMIKLIIKNRGNINAA